MDRTICEIRGDPSNQLDEIQHQMEVTKCSETKGESEPDRR